MPPTKRSIATTSSTSVLANPRTAAGMFRRTITVTDGTPSSSSASSMAIPTTTYLELTQDECRMLRSSSSVDSHQQHSSPAPSHLHSSERLKPTNSFSSSSSSLVSSTTTLPPSYEDQKGGAGVGEVFLALPCVYCGRWVSTRLRTTAELLSNKSAQRIDYPHPEHHDAEQTATTQQQQQKDEGGAPLRVRRSSTLFNPKEAVGSGGGVAVREAKGTNTTLNHHDDESLWMPSEVACQWMYCLLSRPPPPRPPSSSSLGHQTYATSSSTCKDDDDNEVALAKRVAAATLATTTAVVEGGGDAVGAGANLSASVSNELAGVVAELPKTVASPEVPPSPDACAGSRLPSSAAFIACVHQPPSSCTSSTAAATSSASEATTTTLSGAWTSERDSIRSQNSSLIERMRQLKDERRQRGLALLNLDVLKQKDEKKRRRDGAAEEEEKTHPTTTVISSSTSSPSFPTMMQEYLAQLNQQLDTLAVFPSMTATSTSLSVAAPVATRGRKPLSELPAVQTDALGLFACCSLCGKWRRVSRPFPATEGFLCAASSWSLNHHNRSDATTVSRDTDDLSVSMSSRLRMIRMSCEVPEVPSLMTAMLLVQGALWKGALKRLTVARKRTQPLTLLGATRAVSKRAREGVNHDGRVAPPPTAASPAPSVPPLHPSARSKSSSSSSQPKAVPPSRPAVERTPSSSSAAAQPQPGERIKGGRQQQQQQAKQEGDDAATHRRRMTHREEVNVVVHTPTEDEETRSTAALRAAIINVPEENGKPETKETSRRPTAKKIAHPESSSHAAEQQEIIISSHRKRGRPTTTKKPEEVEEQKSGEQHEGDEPIDRHSDRRRRREIEAESVVVAVPLSVDDDIGLEQEPNSEKTKKLSTTTHDDEQQQEQQQRRSSRERIRSPAEIVAPTATRRRQRQEELHEVPAKRTPPRETATTTTKKGAERNEVKKAADETDRVAADDATDGEDEEDRQYWVQCDDCSKWRILRQKLDESSVSKWTCTSSPVPGTTCRTSCDTKRQSAVLRILFS